MNSCKRNGICDLITTKNYITVVVLSPEFCFLPVRRESPAQWISGAQNS